MERASDITGLWATRSRFIYINISRSQCRRHGDEEKADLCSKRFFICNRYWKNGESLFLQAHQRTGALFALGSIQDGGVHNTTLW